MSNDKDETKNAESNALNCCQIGMLIVVVLAVITGVCFSLATLTACNFVSYESNMGDNATLSVILSGTNGTYPVGANGKPASSIDLGLFRYNPSGTGCIDYADPSKSGWLLAAEVGGVIGLLGGAAAAFILIVELTCCRFVCARCMVAILLVMAFLGQGLTFLVYASEACVSRSFQAYACVAQRGSILSIIATGTYFICSIAVCPIPKPKPLLKMLIEHDFRGGKTDPCCPCFRREKPVDEEAALFGKEVVPPAPLPLTPHYQTTHGERYPAEVYAGTTAEASIDGDGLSVVTPAGNVIPMRRPANQTSFANAEVIQEDLFFDSKTV